jgi:hypothetical protein
MMARSTTRSNQKPDTLMQTTSARVGETSCAASVFKLHREQYRRALLGYTPTLARPAEPPTSQSGALFMVGF